MPMQFETSNQRVKYTIHVSRNFSLPRAPPATAVALLLLLSLSPSYFLSCPVDGDSQAHVPTQIGTCLLKDSFLITKYLSRDSRSFVLYLMITACVSKPFVSYSPGLYGRLRSPTANHSSFVPFLFLAPVLTTWLGRPPTVVRRSLLTRSLFNRPFFLS